eukprot:scaffold188_cov336-Pavlova_lutheri.AAC.9
MWDATTEFPVHGKYPILARKPQQDVIIYLTRSLPPLANSTRQMNVSQTKIRSPSTRAKRTQCLQAANTSRSVKSTDTHSVVTRPGRLQVRLQRGHYAAKSLFDDARPLPFVIEDQSKARVQSGRALQCHNHMSRHGPR